MQAREKEDGATSGNEREAKAWRKSATILAKLFVSGVRKQDQKLRPVRGTDRSPNSPANLYIISYNCPTTQDAIPIAYTLENAVSGIRRI